MRNVIYSDRAGARVIPLRVTGASTTATISNGLNDFSSVTLASSVFTCTPRYGFRTSPFLFGSASSASAGGYVTFSDVGVSSFKANSLAAGGTAADNTINVLAAGFDRGDTNSFSLINPVNFHSPMYVEVFKVQGTGTAALLSHTSRATLTDNGTGHYTIALREDLVHSSPIVFGTVIGSTCGVVCPHTIGPKSIVVKTYDADGVAADCDFHLFVFCSTTQNLFGGTRKPLQSTYRSPRLHLMQLDVSGGTPTLTYAPTSTSVVDTGTGVFTITYGRAFKREAYVLIGNQKANVDTQSETGCVIRTFNAAGTAADPSTPIWLMVLGFDDAAQYW